MRVVLMIVALSAALCSLAFAEEKPCEGFAPLFDGKTLDGWHALPGGQWKVVDGVIVGTSEKSERRHGILVTDKQFDDFVLRIEYKPVQGNSGLYFRVDEVDHPVGVHGFQAEIAPEGNAGGLYETGGRAWVVQPSADAVREHFKPGDWNAMTVSAIERHIVVTVNGHKMAELTDDPGRTKGHIGLQLHGGQDMHVEFRKVEIREP